MFPLKKPLWSSYANVKAVFYYRGLGANDPSAINFIGHQRNFEDMVNAVELGRPPLITWEEALKAVTVIDAIYRSARNNGEWIDL